MKSYIYKKSHYLIQHTIPGIFTLLIGLYCLIRQVMTGFDGLLMFVLIICVYNVWNEFVSLSNPYEFDLGEETITFRGYNKEHTYKISDSFLYENGSRKHKDLYEHRQRWTIKRQILA